MIISRRSGPLSPVLFIALAITIPAFYLVLSGPGPQERRIGSLLYTAAALLVALAIALRRAGPARGRWQAAAWDILLACGALASAWPGVPPWSLLEWLLRLGFCGIVFMRLSELLAKWVGPHHLLQILWIGVVALALAGGGFSWLEPKVGSYADGLWLAFITGATVGYGDLVPSTPASRIFAVFIVLLGYAIFSVVTASIAALFVGEDEKRLAKDLHADMRALRSEIASLRGELWLSLARPGNAELPQRGAGRPRPE